MAHRVSPPVLPLEDYKIILRPRSGLTLAALSEITLLRIIQSTAGIPSPRGMQDRIKICSTPNFVIISTPEEKHVPLHLGTTTLPIQGKEHLFNTHVAAPGGTSVGLLHGIPPEDSPDLVLTTLQQHNPRVPILSTRRLGNTEAMQVLIDSPRIPFWLKYYGAQRRCTPFRQRREACVNCWRAGHRKDVCPHPAVNRYVACGLENPEQNHTCTPTCIVCNDTHPTGHPTCHYRFQKRRRAPGPRRADPTPPQSPTDNNPRQRPPPTQGALGDPGGRKKRTSRVSWADAARSASPNPTPSPPVAPSWAELDSIRAENIRLRDEITRLKAASKPSTVPSAAPAAPSAPKLSIVPPVPLA
ncbi:unnamed protein product, partial [Ixodes hexagonus]